MSETEENDFGALLAAFDQEQAADARPAPKVGAKVPGTILSIGAEVAFVDIGAKAEGMIPVEEMTDQDGDLAYSVGDRVEALVSGRDAEGAWLLRLRPGRGETLPEEIRAAQEHGLPVEGVVTGINKGGAEVQVAGLRAFCPVSQLDARYVEDPSVFQGQRLRFRVTRFEAGASGRAPNLVLSRRVLLEEEAAQRAAETRERLEVGAVLTGTVSSIASFGAFVDLGGLEGLVHVSEMSHQRVENPADLLTVGQEVEVKILKIEEREGEERISLSLRALEDDPWRVVPERYPVGTVVQGQVRRTEAFGAFVELEPGVEGLVHVSELSADRHVKHPREVVSAGDSVAAKVLAIDGERKRISLSLAAVRTDAKAAEEAQAKRDFDASQKGEGGLGTLADAFAKLREE